MEAVGIARLKARLSHYLRQARSGEVVTVLDRGTAVAQLVPAASSAGLVLKPPKASLRKLKSLPPSKVKVDIVEALLEARQPQR